MYWTGGASSKSAAADPVAVIGGGPGAAAAALTLARDGARVVLFRPARPGEKPCGGALPASRLPPLPGFDLGALPSVEATRFLVENADGSCVALDVEGVYVYRRADLDAALVDTAVAAGAELVAHRVESLEHGDRGVDLVADGCRRRFSWVIGADGGRGLSRRSLGRFSAGDSLGIGASIDGDFGNCLTLAFPGVTDAYLWIFPRPGGVSVGVAYSEARLSRGAAESLLRRFLDRRLEGGASRLAEGRRYRYPIPVYGSDTLPALEAGVLRRLLLVGDAAGLADPLTREGIRYAILSGVLAAESLLENQPQRYPRRVALEIGREMSRALAARELFFEAPIGQLLVPVCRMHPGVRRVLADLLGCRQPYHGLRRRLLRSAVGL